MRLPNQSIHSRNITLTRTFGLCKASTDIVPSCIIRTELSPQFGSATRKVPTEFGFAAVGQVLEDCKYGGADYTEGSTVCQAGTKHKCIKQGDDFLWSDQGTAC